MASPLLGTDGGRRCIMTGNGVLQYLRDICDGIDQSAKTALRRTALAAALPVAASFTVACYGVPTYLDDYPRDEICANSVDDDGDGLTDCQDDDCSSLEICLGCDDGQDNDGDGLADCSDASCSSVAPCSDELCGDGIDNDGDGVLDCDDTDCEAEEGCQVVYLDDDRLVAACGDGVDNDGDGLTDCNDSSCSGGEYCMADMGCADDTDNDGDGLVDCYDPDCFHVPVCN
jgi:hypothetical protein